jgi:hypothetical protein
MPDDVAEVVQGPNDLWYVVCYVCDRGPQTTFLSEARALRGLRRHLNFKSHMEALERSVVE